MKIKRILRFYFFCESLDRALDNLIMKKALVTGADSDGVKAAECICKVIYDKSRLSDLWRYMDGIMTSLSDDDLAALKGYAAARGSVKSFDDKTRKEWRRAAVKFRRRARRLDRFSESLKLVGKYYCLLSSGYLNS